MQHVKSSWLRNYNYCLIFLTACLGVAYLCFEYFSVSERTKDTWGITPLVLMLGGLHAAYTLIIYPFFNKRFTLTANMVPITLYAFLFATIIDTSGNVNLVYRIGYAVFIFLSALNGWIPPLLAVILTWLVLLFTITGIATPTKASLTFNLVINLIVTLAGFFGWFIFKRWYSYRNDPATRKLEGLLEQEQFKSGIIIESITDGVLILDPNGTIQIINLAAAQLLGWDQKEAAHLDYKSIVNVLDDKDSQDAITSCLNTQEATQKTQLFSTRNGRQRYIDTVASPVMQAFEQHGESTSRMVGVIAILRDVDEQKRQEQQRNDFISTASHEMRTPVASIQGFLELALNPKVSTIDEKARGYLGKAHQATSHLGKLFSDLLTISQNDDGRLQYNPQVFDLQQFVERLFSEAKVIAERAGLSAVLDNDKGSLAPLIYAKVDPARFQEVFMNLFENAVKYTKVGSVTVGLTAKENLITLRISDTGMGIAQEDIPHIFQKFYRTDNSETRAIGGTGLGLYIVQQLVNAMEGKITVESTVGAGSSFYITIPRVMPDQVNIKPETNAPQA